MEELSDIELKKILQRKLEDFEADPPLESEGILFNGLNARKSGSVRIWSRISLIALLVMINFGNEVVLKIEEDVSPLSSSATDNFNTTQKSLFLSGGQIFSTKDNSILSISELNKIKEHNPKNGIHDGRHNKPLQRNLKATLIDSRTSLSTLDELHKKESRYLLPDNTKSGSPIFSNALDSSIFIKSTERARLKKNNVAKDSLDTTKVTEGLKANKIYLSFSYQPFLGYKDIRPLADGVYVYNVGVPSAVSSERLGVKFTTFLEKEIGTNKFITLGISYFIFKNSFAYQANESVRDIHRSNNFYTQTKGAAFSLGTIYPLKISSVRKQFVQLKVESQWLHGAPSSQCTQVMISAGYPNQWAVGKGLIRVIPTLSYSVTKLHYPGVMVQQYWLGLEMGYSIHMRR